ncbi:histidine phosphatase family protein [Phenylobacterium aquaticum]|uniref:histidine phosphatase family protein n=1 Tax=Phenylobacterium aquaticum TaxID=1763816 RepID=UPI0026F2A191|nr:histidine phosphatase family protein [Phenylobacterium aquaticum]
MGNQAHRPPRRLILVKHGQPKIDPDAAPTTWPLSDEGRAAATALAGKLDRFEPVALASSSELKAVQTAQAIAAVLGLPLSQDAGLGEQRNETGGFHDQQVFEALVARMFQEPHHLVLGEETGEAARRRFADALDRQMAAHPDGTLVVVAHGRVISLWAAQVLGVDAMPLWKHLGLATALVISADRDDFEIVA